MTKHNASDADDRPARARHSHSTHPDSATTKVDFDAYTDNYNELLKESTSFFCDDEAYFAKYKVDILSRELRSPIHRLLEYGCGIGRNIAFLRERFRDATIVGSDISSASLDVARRENPGVEFLLDPPDRAPAGSFDAIMVAGVFHHVPVEQRNDVANQLFELLRPGGELIVFEHNPFNPITRRIVNRCAYDEDAVLLRPAELTGILRRASFERLRRRYCLFVPPKLGWLVRIEAALGWLPLGGQYWLFASRPSQG